MLEIETIKVDDIFEIEGIEKMLNYRFNFCNYDRADNTLCYEYLKGYCFYDIVIRSSENIFTATETLSDIITFDDIQYFSLRIEVVKSGAMSVKNYTFIKPQD